MSQRESGYARKDHDLYETPEWVTHALVPHLRSAKVWEPACGSGKIVRALESCAVSVLRYTDISSGWDFFNWDMPAPEEISAIVTNPPYTQATRFVEHALVLMMDRGGQVAMLLRADFDSAKSRRHLFAECQAFTKKLVLTKRITWFEPAVASPSFNHAWFIWDWRHHGPPTIAYGPESNQPSLRIAA